jgi:hypothetical protein
MRRFLYNLCARYFTGGNLKRIRFGRQCRLFVVDARNETVMSASFAVSSRSPRERHCFANRIRVDDQQRRLYGDIVRLRSGEGNALCSSLPIQLHSQSSIRHKHTETNVASFWSVYNRALNAFIHLRERIFRHARCAPRARLCVCVRNASLSK